MSVFGITQAEADALLLLKKHRVDDTVYDFPGLGGALRIPLRSIDHKEEFMLDITRSKIELKKNTFQNRARKIIILARIDLQGSPHRNPDHKIIPTPHLHLYREGYGDKWAQPLPNAFSNPEDTLKTLEEFMDYCIINKKPIIQRGLFA